MLLYLHANRNRSIAVTLITLVLMVSCSKEPEVEMVPVMMVPVLPATYYNYEDIQFPESFDFPPLNFNNSSANNNPVTNSGATLGRVLFYDKNLSINHTTSCGSCHHQEKAFADPEVFSTGHGGGKTHRNASHLVNFRFNNRVFWDLRATNLEVQVLMPIQDEIEMGMTLDELELRLSTIDYYAPLFSDAFGDAEITSERIALALGQFVRSIVSYHTKFDEGWPTFDNFSEEELLGRGVYMSTIGNCSFCHFPVSFHNPQALNNGLDLVYEDGGLGDINGNAADIGKFKVPSLRNVELTAPYMHDGRFQTLEEVIEHYNSGVQQHPNLDDRLTVETTTGGTPKHLNLSQEQKEGLLAFLKTLTDYSLISDPKFSDPFQAVN